MLRTCRAGWRATPPPRVAGGDNLTLASVGSQHGVPSPLVDLARVIVALVAIVICVRAWQRRDQPVDALMLGYLIILAFLLAAKLYELDYALLLCGAPFVAWRTREKWASGLIIVGTVILFAPSQMLPSAQSRDAVFWTAGTLLVFGGIAWVCFCGRPRLPVTSAA